MTVVKASFVNGVRVPIGGGTVTYTPDRLRATVADASKTVTPVEVVAEIVAGVAQDRDLEPGPYSVRIEVEWFLETYPIIVPAAGPVQLIALIDDSTPYEPPVLSLVKQYRDQAQQASAIAVAAAEGVAGISEDLAQIAQDRAAAELARDKSIEAQGISESAAGSAGDSATNAGNSARDAKDFRDGAEEFATAADGSATAAGQSEEAARLHKVAAEAASERSEQIAAGIQDVADDAAQVAEDRLAVESATSAVATDWQTVTDARDVVVTAKQAVEQIQTDVGQTKTAIENTANLVDQTLEQYGTQFVAERELSQQAVTDATSQAQRSADAADIAVEKAGDASQSALEAKQFRDEAQGAVAGVSSFDGVTGDVTKAQVGLDLVDNTRDADKQVSVPTQQALTDLMAEVEADFTGLSDRVDEKTTVTQAQGIALAAIAAWVGNTPEALDTLEELAAALGNNPNFATDVLDLIGQKAAVGHKHSAADIDTGTLPVARGGTGRANLVAGSYLVGAGDSAVAGKTPAQVREDIGAGTGNSNLEIGTTSSTAMRGDANQVVTALPTTGQLTGVIYHVTE